MKLLLRRDQRSGLLGKVTFVLDVRAQITEDERADIKKYRFGDTMLYQKHVIHDRDCGEKGVKVKKGSETLNVPPA